MDWANRRRVKIWGEARLVEANNTENEALIERLRPAKLNRAARRAIIFEVAAWDLNCPQHIPQLFQPRRCRGGECGDAGAHRRARSRGRAA
jgi:hypothetical protein